MKKNIYKLNNIDCAACANKIEKNVSELNGVISSNLNFILLKFLVTFDENIINDEEIENCIHESLNNVEIVEKNNKKFIDTYKKPKIFKKILFKGRKNKNL